MIRSTPSRSGSGNMTPASITIVVSSQDTAIMFIPNWEVPQGDHDESGWRLFRHRG